LFGDKVTLNGHPQLRLPNTLNVSFLGYEGYTILSDLSDVAASTGSACHSGTTTLSPVLHAMKVTEEVGRGAIRFSLGRMTSKEEVDKVLKELQKMK
jgi:cysteine desulfurase